MYYNPCARVCVTVRLYILFARNGLGTNYTIPNEESRTFFCEVSIKM